MKKCAIYETRYGFIRIEYENEVVHSIKKVDDYGSITDNKVQFSDFVFNQLCEYFEGKRKEFTFEYKVKGTNFQEKVWSALCQIPYGETRTYKEIAVMIGNENASRAVGMANNKNPLHFVVPCHRVVGRNGKLVGYAGGLELKEYLLDMESVRK